MEEEEKPVKLKGIDTGKEGGGTYSILPVSKPSDVYKEPKTAEQAFAQKLGNVAEVAVNPIMGTDFNVDPRAIGLYTPVDLAAGIRDPDERAKFLNEHGSRMTKLMGQDQYGIRFNHEIKDYAAYKEKLYDKRVDKFLDDLDENQGFLAEVGNTATKLIGNIGLAAAGIIPVVYGIGKGLFTWDAQNIFNNGMFDAWETMEEGLNSKFAVYGGSDYDLNEDGSQKNFFSRFVSHPMKSLNKDIAPAVSFIAGAIITEMLAVPLGAMTGGTALVANTARLGAQATRTFARGASELGTLGIKGTNLLLPKGMKVLRGLETLTDYQKAKQVAVLSQKYRATLGTATSMVRSAGYESSLIARDTYDSTLESLLAKHGELNGEPPTEAEMALYKQKAGDASEYAWFTNIPLVGFSNMMQFPKIFAGGYKVNQALSRLSPLRSTGTVINKAGQRQARSEVLGKWGRTAAIGGAMLKSGVTEGFEEFSQGVLEHGLADYYTAKYTKNSRETSIGLLSAMNTAARNYAGTTEGQDSMTIGFLMGMVGLRLPMRINKETGKLEKGWASYGGAREARKELKQKWAQDAVNAEYQNTNSTQDALKANYDNMARGVTTQEDQDAALAAGDKYGFKNSEHSSMHSFVSTRIQLGLEDTIFQDLDAFQALPLANFNDQFATKGVKDFTEETRKESLDKVRNETNNVIKATKEVNALFNDTKVLVDFLRKDYKGLQDPKNITGALKEQMIYLHSANKNFSEREKSLESEVQDLTDGKINPTVFRNIIGRITGVRKDDGSAEMITSAKELYKAAMQDWKSEDPVGYNLHSKEVAPILQDLVKIKVKKAQLSTMYNMLFTKSGAEKFAEFYELLEEHYVGEAHKQVLEQIANAAKNSKTADRTTKNSMDEKSITGDTPIVNAQTKKEADLADAEVAAMINQNSPQDASQVADLSSLIPLVSPTEILKILEGKPGLFAAIRKSLLDKGIVIGDTVSEVRENLVEDPKIGPAIVSEFAKLMAANSSEESVKDQSLDFADERDASQPNPVPQEELTLEQQLEQSLNKLERAFTPGQQVNTTAIIGVTHDKKIEGGKLIRDPAKGRFIKRKTAQKADTALLNSPEFLSNAELKAEFKYVQFKLEETIPWKDEKGNTVEITEANTRIGAYHNGIFLMDLPAFTAGMPLNFLALRKAIIAQETGVAVEEETVSTDAKVEGTNTRGTTYKGETTEKDGLKVTKYSEFNPEGKRISKGGRIMTPAEFIKEYNITDQDYLDNLEEATEIRIYEVRVGKDGRSGISIQATFSEGNIEMEVAGAELASASTDIKADVEKEPLKFIKSLSESFKNTEGITIEFTGTGKRKDDKGIENTTYEIEIKKDGKSIGVTGFKIVDGKVEISFTEINEKYQKQGISSILYQDINQALVAQGYGVLYSDTTFLNTQEKQETFLIVDGKELSLDETSDFLLSLEDPLEDLERLKKEGRVKEVKKVKPGEKLWQSLENKGLAEKLETGQYKFINAEVAALEGKPTTDTKADIEKRKKEELLRRDRKEDIAKLPKTLLKKNVVIRDVIPTLKPGQVFTTVEHGNRTADNDFFASTTSTFKVIDSQTVVSLTGSALTYSLKDKNSFKGKRDIYIHEGTLETIEEINDRYNAELDASVTTPISEREALIAQYLKTIAEQAEIKTQGCK